jgi:peptidoglycan glycosyltransferase
MENIFERSFVCEGVMHTTRGVVTCMRSHGEISLGEAMTVSCNIVFGTLALELGAETLARYARSLGLSESTTVGGIRTASGNFERAEPGTADLAWSGVGQFTNTVCPAAKLRFVGAIANGGVAVEMSLTQRTGISALTSPSTSRIMSVYTAHLLAELIDYSIQAPGNLASFPGLQIHAKTGTAEVGDDLQPHAWIAGYITNPDFPLAFVVMVEHGGGGFAVAGPIANRVLQTAVSG